MIVDNKLVKIMLEDIKTCESAQSTAKGSKELFQILISKYDGIFENFKDEIKIAGKMSFDGPANYGPELNAIKEKLEVLIAVNDCKMRQNDNLYDFKKQFIKDTEELKSIIDDFNNIGPSTLNPLYDSLIAKYSKIVPDFSDNIEGYRKSDGFFFPVERVSLKKNIKNIYEKMMVCVRLNFINIKFADVSNIPFFQINNNNQNTMEVNLTFEQLKDRVENITSVNNEEIDEILEKINEIEDICKSNDRKTKKWEKIKKILVWIMDKGIDVAIQVIPTVINNLK